MITVVLPRSAGSRDEGFPNAFLRNPLIRKIVVLDAGGGSPLPVRCETLACDDPEGGRTWNALLASVATRYLLYFPRTDVRPDPRATARLLAVAEATGAGMVYADYAEIHGETLREHPVNDYQQGSLRDGFDFGPLILISTAAARGALRKYGEIPPCRWAGWYDLRLKLSTDRELFHLPERLSVLAEAARAGAGGTGTAGGGQFAYVDPRNRIYQQEMEGTATAHLKRIGAWLAPAFRDIPPSNHPFPVEASIVIPVRNRVRTVADAVGSALAQRTDFPFNVIAVDNHSTDGTTGILADLACRHSYLTHIIPERRDLSIGGCWNEAVFSEACGRYAIQLDSDDLYQGDDVLRRLVDALRRGNCALVVGSYTIVDGDLSEIPPGLIDHREWTEENGRNNALRINGLGAPRAFDTTILRGTGFPNVGYGEDYAVALRLSREYRIGRIYESLYLCRRLEGNTDAALTVEQANRHDAYKDRLRTIEIRARRRQNGVRGWRY
ncbi:MAG: glycosyltransferase family A protein [Deltaproteobacteria bacterium]|nr:glycosyltransferase family A protein [Deltaproteobacteria bacterium]